MAAANACTAELTAIFVTCAMVDPVRQWATLQRVYTVEDFSLLASCEQDVDKGVIETIATAGVDISAA